MQLLDEQVNDPGILPIRRELDDILEQLDAGAIATGETDRIRSFLEDRYRWSIDIADSLTGYLCLQGLDRLQPGFYRSQLPAWVDLLGRDMQATMNLKDGPRGVAIANMIIELRLAKTCDWIVFNLACGCQNAGLRKEAVRLYRWVHEHGSPRAKRDAASNLYFVLSGVCGFEEIAERLETCSPASDLYPEALIDARYYERAKATSLEAFEESPKSAADHWLLVRRMLGCGDLAGAVKAATLPDGLRTPQLDYIQRLYIHVDRRIAEIRGAGKAPTDGAFGQVICWGESFTRAFLDWTLPTLLQPGNFPRLAAYKPVELRIVTDVVGRMIFKFDPRMRELERCVTVTYEVLPAPMLAIPPDTLDVGIRYLLFGSLWHLAVIEAMATGRDVFLVGADVIYSADSWDYIGELAAGDAEVIFACTFSANQATIAERLRSYIDADGILSIGHRELMDEAFRHLHPRSRGGFVTDYNRHRTNNVSYLFFPTEDGLIERVLAPTPLYLKHSALRQDAVFDFMTNDGRFIDRILPESDDWNRIHHITDNERYCSLELSPPEKNTGEGSIARITPAQVASHADSYRFIRKMRQMIDIGYRFRGTKPPPWPPYDSSAFLSELLRLLREA